MEKLVFTICGRRGRTNRLFLDDRELFPERSVNLVHHSSTGFEWGYLGSGPAQTALAICLEIMPHEWMALALYQSFKHAFVSDWKEDDFEVTIDVTDFLISHRGLYELAREREQYRCKK
jgi:hypothetical protein